MVPPCVSIVLPVYNVAPHIIDTISSLLAQTYSDFELLVLDDCSTDETADKVQSISDPRLHFIQNPYNLGRAGTDNAAIVHVRGKYLAKADGDDLYHPERLAQQVAFLEQHPDVNVVGAWVQSFEASTHLAQYPVEAEAARVLTLFTLPTGNPTVMLRTSLFKEGEMTYDSALRQTEDYDFFARYIRDLTIATLPIALVKYRVPPSASKKGILTERAEVADQIRSRLLDAWGVSYTERELRIHNTIAMVERPLGDITLAEVESWLHKLLQFNTENPWFSPTELKQGLATRWFETCYNHPQAWFGSIRKFRRSILAGYFSVGYLQMLKFLVKSLTYRRGNEFI